jgi:hypothetical protein
MKKIRVWTNDARNVDPDFADALGNALAIETSLIDKSYYKFVETDSEDLKAAFSQLVIASQVHRRKVVQLTNAYNEMNA